MNELLDYLPYLFDERLQENRRPPDGLLHPSSDLVGSLRHTMLRAAGAPEKPRTLTDDIVLMTGTLWHEWANSALLAAGVPVMQEVKLDAYLPDGWSGKPDWVFWDSQLRGFVLGDLKTIRGDGLSWIERDGAKLEHIWQLSAYWWGLYDMGLPMVKQVNVLYWPKDRPSRAVSPIQASLQEFEPLSRELVHGVMEDRWQAVKTYLDSFGGIVFTNEFLAAEQGRIQKLAWEKRTETFDLKLAPHWSTTYCPFDSALCQCSEQGETKIGSYDLHGSYRPRKGYESIEPSVVPEAAILSKRAKECRAR